MYVDPLKCLTRETVVPQTRHLIFLPSTREYEVVGGYFTGLEVLFNNEMSAASTVCGPAGSALYANQGRRTIYQTCMLVLLKGHPDFPAFYSTVQLYNQQLPARSVPNCPSLI